MAFARISKFPPPLLPLLPFLFHSIALPSLPLVGAGQGCLQKLLEWKRRRRHRIPSLAGVVGPTTTGLSLSVSLAVGPHPNGRNLSNRLAVAGYMSPPPPAPPRETCSPPASSSSASAATFVLRFGISSNTSRPSPSADRGAVRRDPIRRLLPRAVTTSTTTRTTPPQQQHV